MNVAWDGVVEENVRREGVVIRQDAKGRGEEKVAFRIDGGIGFLGRRNGLMSFISIFINSIGSRGVGLLDRRWHLQTFQNDLECQDSQ